MTLGLWIFVGGWFLILGCFVVCHFIARAEQRQRQAEAEGADRTAYLTVKQRAMGKRLRRQGRSLLTGKPYTPVLTKPAEFEEQPQRQLYAIRGGKR